MSGNTGYAGGTRGADPVPARQSTAPDGSTVLGTEDDYTTDPSTDERPPSEEPVERDDRDEVE